MVTGLIITPDQKISIGRERKRLISACIHKFALGQANAKQVEYVRGLLAFANSVEPEFVLRMKEKYGAAVVNQLVGSD